MATLPSTIPAGGASPVGGVYEPSKLTIPTGATVDVGNGSPMVATSLANTGTGGLVRSPSIGTGTGSTAPGYSRLPDPSPINDPLGTGNESQAVKDTRQTLVNLAQTIDSINKTYDARINDFKATQGANNIGSVNAASALMGLAGSSAATARETGVAGSANQKGEDQINAERTRALNAAIGQIDKAHTNYSDAVKAQQTDSQIFGDLANNTKDAMSQIAAVLPGVSFKDLASTAPLTYQKLKTVSGLTDAGLEIMWNAYQKSSGAANEELTTINGMPVVFDKSTGKATPRPDLLSAFPAGAQQSPFGSNIQTIGSNVYAFPLDSNGKVNIPPGGKLSDYEIGGVSPTDKFQVVQGKTMTDAFGNQYNTGDRVFDQTTGKFVSGSSSDSSSGSSTSPAPSNAGSQSSTPLSFGQYGLLANVKDFNPSNTVDGLAYRYLDAYIKNGSIPSATTLGRAMKPEAMAQVQKRASDLYFAATGHALPNPAVIKQYQTTLGNNIKMANNLKIQEQTVSNNVDLSLANMQKNDLNSAGFKPLNNLINTVDDAFNDPQVGQLLAQNTTIQNELGSLLAVKNAAGTTVYDKLSSAGIISSGDSPDQIKQKVTALLQEAGNFADSISMANADIYKQIDPFMQDPNNPLTSVYQAMSDGKAVQLRDPQSGEVRSFDDMTPKDLEDAMAAGYIPTQ